VSIDEDGELAAAGKQGDMAKDHGTVDGRRARADENRRKVVLSMLALIRETGELPSVEAIAERAAVSRRSVFRLCDDRGALLGSAVEEQAKEILVRFPPPSPFEGDAESLVDAYVGHLARVYEYIAPIRRIAERVKVANPDILEAQAHYRTAERHRLSVFFAVALPEERSARERLLVALQVSCSWQTWSLLRDDLGHSPRKASALMAFMMSSILAASPSS
jgi:AcrR family transcriptional regulator